MAIKTDKDRVLAHLLAGNSITRLQATLDFNTNSLLDIIHRLRKEGHSVIDCWCRNKNTGKRFKKYMIGRKF